MSTELLPLKRRATLPGYLAVGLLVVEALTLSGFFALNDYGWGILILLGWLILPAFICAVSAYCARSKGGGWFFLLLELGVVGTTALLWTDIFIWEPDPLSGIAMMTFPGWQLIGVGLATTVWLSIRIRRERSSSP